MAYSVLPHCLHSIGGAPVLVQLAMASPIEQSDLLRAVASRLQYQLQPHDEVVALDPTDLSLLGRLPCCCRCNVASSRASQRATNRDEQCHCRSCGPACWNKRERGSLTCRSCHECFELHEHLITDPLLVSMGMLVRGPRVHGATATPMNALYEGSADDAPHQGTTSDTTALGRLSLELDMFDGYSLGRRPVRAEIPEAPTEYHDAPAVFPAPPPLPRPPSPPPPPPPPPRPPAPPPSAPPQVEMPRRPDTLVRPKKRPRQDDSDDGDSWGDWTADRLGGQLSRSCRSLEPRM